MKLGEGAVCFVKAVYVICEHKVGFCCDFRMDFPPELCCIVENKQAERVSALSLKPVK